MSRRRSDFPADVQFGEHLTRRHREGRPLFGLPGTFTGRRWLAREGADDLGLAHGDPRPSPSPLITVGVLGGTDLDQRGLGIDVYGTLGNFLLLAERSRNDPSFQHATRDQEAIVTALDSVPGRDAWTPTTIEVDGVPLPFLRCERGGDWIAFHDLAGECVWVHVEQPNGEAVSLVTLDDVTPYLE